MPPRAAILVALIPLITSCATTSSNAADTSARATLEVVNRTALDWEISLGGWTLGSVPAGSRRAFRELSAGLWSVSAWRAGYSVKRAELSAGIGDTVLWEIAPPPGAGQPLPMPPTFGVLRVNNPSRLDLNLRLDDADELRSLLGGDSRRIVDVPAGEHALHVTVPGARYRRTVTVAIAPGRTTEIEAPLETGELRITNATGEQVRVFVDGIERQLVADGRTETLDGLLRGVHALRAVGASTSREHLRQIDIAHGQRIEWDLAASKGRLRIVNRSGEPLAITTDGTARGRLKSDAALELDDVPLGDRIVTARSERSGYGWVAEVPLVAGHRITWTIRNDVGTLRVVNRLSEAIEVRLGDRVVLLVRPGETGFADELPGGSQRISAFGTVSHVVQRQTIDVSPGGSAVWIVEEPQARLHVRNRTAEPVVVYADQRPLGRVRPGEDIIFTQVPPGERLVEARGELSDDVTRTRRSLSAREIVVWDVATSTGEVRVVNESGEPLLAPPGLRPQGEAVDPGSSRVYAIPVGHRVLHFLGRESRQSYHRRATVLAGETLEWTVGALEGVLHVFNRTAEPQRVRIGDTEAVVLAAGKDRKVRLRAGPYRVVAVGEASRNAIEASVVVHAGASHGWSVVRGVGSVRVANQTPEIVDLRRNGQPLGFVEPGAQRAYGPWPPGEWEISAQGRWSRAIYQVSLELVAGRVEAWTILPARGAVLVSNRRDEAIRVLLDHEELAVVEPHEQVRFEIPIGPRLVEIVGRDSLQIFRHRLRVRPDRTYSVDAPLGPAELLVRNRLSLPLTLLLDGKDRGIAPAGGELRVPLHHMGRQTVHAVAPDGRLTWHRRIEVTGDRVITWEIRQ